jgi:pimeloyl-ACP methyl ester carboxylesterase
MALEAGRRGLARRVVAISPIGLWRDHPAAHVPYVFGGMRFAVKHFLPLVKAAFGVPLLRELALAVPLSVGSRRMSAVDARRALDDLAAATAFEPTFESTRPPYSGVDIAVPVTVAFGDRDWILTSGSRHRSRLPPQTAWITMNGWGHVPMWIDPHGAARLILDGTN